MAATESVEALSDVSDGSSPALAATENDGQLLGTLQAERLGMDVPTHGRELDDEALRGLTESELEQLMAALQAGKIGARHTEPKHSSAGDAPPGSPPGFARYPEELVPPKRIRRDARAPPPTVPQGAVVMLVIVAVVCVAVLIGLVLKADDPCDARLEQRCGSLRLKLDALEHERDALRRELRTAITDRERFSQEAEQLRNKKPSCPPESANRTGGLSAGHLPRELAKVPPLPELNCPACPPCPSPSELPLVAASAVDCPVCKHCPEADSFAATEAQEEMEHLNWRIRLLERDNEHLRGQPERLLDDFHKQSQEIWMLRSELAKVKTPDTKNLIAGAEEADSDEWMQRARTEGTQLRQELGSCQIELAKAQEVREKVLQLVTGAGDSLAADQ